MECKTCGHDERYHANPLMHNLKTSHCTRGICLCKHFVGDEPVKAIEAESKPLPLVAEKPQTLLIENKDNGGINDGKVSESNSDNH